MLAAGFGSDCSRAVNSKIASYRAEWARFPGFSLLFDNPGGGVRDTAHGSLLHCEPHAYPQQTLLAAIADWAADALDADAFWRLGICATPVSSYHVTAWDGLNPALEERLTEPSLSAIRRCFAAIPAQSEDEAPFQAQLAPVQADLSALLPIRFRAAGLRSTPRVGLVVDLCPADAESQERFEAFQACRRSHAEHLCARWGAAYTGELQPHVTVAYYANPPDRPTLDDARSVAIAAWQSVVTDRTRELEIAFEGLGLYVFPDMAHFYRRESLIR